MGGWAIAAALVVVEVAPRVDVEGSPGHHSPPNYTEDGDEDEDEDWDRVGVPQSSALNYSEVHARGSNSI